MHIVIPGAAKYLNESGILGKLNNYVEDYGKRPFFLSGQKAYGAVENRILLKESSWGKEIFSGECSYENIKLYKEKALEHQADVIIGVGGGKAIDTAKAIADQLNLPLITIPTVASTCAAWTPLSVIYTEAGAFIEYTIFRQGPALVLVEPEVLIHAPKRYFIAGIGDTYAKYYEAKALCQHSEIKAAAKAGLTIAKLTLSILQEYSELAVKAMEDKQITKDFQDVLDAIIMLGGLVGGLGDKYGRIAAAHSIHNGLTHIPETPHLYHGEKVAYGILVQMVLEHYPHEAIKQTINLFQRLELPTSFEDLGIQHSDIYWVAESACSPGESIHLMPFSISSQAVVEAMEQLQTMVENNVNN